MKRIIAIVMLAAASQAADVVLGRLSELSWTGTGVNKTAAWGQTNHVLVAQMTSSNIPPPLVASAGTTWSTYDAWKAFDRDPVTRWDGYPSGAGNYLSIDFGIGVSHYVAEYSIRANVTRGERTPTGWALEVSTNGTAWTTCETRSVSAFADGEKRTFTNSLPISARYHRLRIITTAASEPMIAEWELIGQ